MYINQLGWWVQAITPMEAFNVSCVSSLTWCSTCTYPLVCLTEIHPPFFILSALDLPRSNPLCIGYKWSAYTCCPACRSPDSKGKLLFPAVQFEQLLLKVCTFVSCTYRMRTWVPDICRSLDSTHLLEGLLICSWSWDITVKISYWHPRKFCSVLHWITINFFFKS